MDIERSTLVQAGAGAASVVVFVVLVLVVGGQASERALTPSGALSLVAALAIFVVFMMVLGLALSDELTDD